MELNKGMSKRKQAIAIIAVIVIVTGIIMSITLSRTKNIRPARSGERALTAGGEQIPKQDQTRAKAAGYWCPSWDSKGTAPDYCLTLDK
jgi:hypothetical protein